MKEAILYEKLKDASVRCHVCQRQCVIMNGQAGYCQTRKNVAGKLYTTVYGLVSSCYNDPIEKKPVFHFKPGSLCFSLGTFGCNFRCRFCQNWEIAYTDPSAKNFKAETSKLQVTPEAACKMALMQGAQGIALTYNEPAIWLEYGLDLFKLAKEENLYTVWVTNGYATQKAIDQIAPYLDVYRVDLKSFDDKFYQQLIKIPRAADIFETTKYVHDQYPKIHLETVTNIVPGWNDDPKMLTKIARFIKENLGPETPWHVTRFYPDAEMQDIPPTPEATLFKAREIGLKEGLKFVYIGNLAVEGEDDTFCPKCGQLAIKRDGYKVEILGVDQKGHCLKCQDDLKIIM